MRLKKILLLSSFVFITFQLNAQIPDGIIQGFKKGDAAALAGFFNQNIQMTILENEDVFSKAQAQQIVLNFFSKNKVAEFNIKHQGGKDDARFAVGDLKAAGGNFRVVIFYKKAGDKTFIHHLRIEKP